MKTYRHDRANLSFIPILALIVVCFWPVASLAQEPNRWKTYPIADGLMMSSYVSDIVQDGQGFLWTGYNLQRFDGYTFKEYNPKDSMRLRMKSAGVLNIDDAGALWIEDGNIIRQYDFEKDGFVSYPSWAHLTDVLHKQGSGGFSNCVAGSKGGLWIGTEHGLFYFDPGTGETQKYFNAGEDSFANFKRNFIIDVVDQGEYLLCGTWGGLWRFDKARKVFTGPWLSDSDSSLLCGKEIDVMRIFPHGDHYWFMIHDHSFANKSHRIKDFPECHYALIKTDSVFSVIQEFKIPYTLTSGL